ncbi:MAG TPA: hypothetical protein VHR66_23210 [Gemmataceae bacterium]|nr:hypothetical protein [Gemmataceae bacterium]
MTLRCPVCRADNTTGLNCRRCKADLSLLIAVEERRDYHVTLAQIAMRDGQFDDALTELTLAEELRTGPDIHRLRACVFLLAGDHESVLAEHAAVVALS